MNSVSPKHKRDLDQWYKDIKKQLTSKAHENYFKRLQEIISIANNKLSNYDIKLNIHSSERGSMWNGIANDINSWKGVEITACTKQKTNYKSYAITSRNWWNRNKAKVYGNHFFYPIIFMYIKQAVYNLTINAEEKAFLFVDIFDEILHAKIQFPQTRAQPIIPHQSFIQPNKFKYSSIDLLKTNGIHWTGKNIDNSTKSGEISDDNDSTSTNSTTSNNSNNNINNMQRQSYYIKDKDRSLKVNNSFMDSLEMLKHRLHQRLINNNPTMYNNNSFKLKIKTEPGAMKMSPPIQPQPIFKTENNLIDHQRLPPSIKIAPKSEPMMLNNILSPPKLAAHYPPSLSQLGNIPNINAINNNNNLNTNFNFPCGTMPIDSSIQSLINSIANGNSSPQSGDTNATISSFTNPIKTQPQSPQSLLNTLLMPNQSLNYGAMRGQTNSVSNQRFSPNMVPSNILPFNLQNIPNSYCSINTDPVSGQLTLSLHIPLS